METIDQFSLKLHVCASACAPNIYIKSGNREFPDAYTSLLNVVPNSRFKYMSFTFYSHHKITSQKTQKDLL